MVSHMADRDGFPPEEMSERLARVRSAMVASGLDACVVLAPESQRWLAGLASFSSGVLSQARIVPADAGREMLLVMWDADVPLARAVGLVEDVRGYRFGVDDPVAAFRAALEDGAPGAEV